MNINKNNKQLIKYNIILIKVILVINKMKKLKVFMNLVSFYNSKTKKKSKKKVKLLMNKILANLII